MILEEEKCFCGSVTSSSAKYSFTRNLKVGSKKEDVLQAFYHENQMKDCIENGQVIGKFLYGNTLRTKLFDAKIKENYSYGFINTYASTQTDSTIEYVYLKAPFISEYASTQDAYCRIVFHFSNDVVTSISWEYCPALLDPTES